MSKLKKFIKSVVSCLALVIIAFPILAGCGKKVVAGTGALFTGNTDFTISASATDDKINLKITTNVKKPKGYKKGSTLDVVMLEPYEYYSGEADTGVNSVNKNFTFSTGETVGKYTVGETKELSLARWVGEKEDNFDLIYKKFVLAKDGKLAAGPFLVNKIESERTYAEKTEVTSKKGITSNWKGEEDYLPDVGAQWTGANVLVANAMYPNEKPYVDENGNVDESRIIPIDNSKAYEDGDAYKYVCDGKTYYIALNVIRQIDYYTEWCKNNGVRLYLVLYNHKNLDEDWDNVPYFLNYPGTSYEKEEPKTNNTLCAMNTANEIGYGYYKAFMEFLAERYSREDGEFGYIHRFVIGNEIDISWEWNPVLDYAKQDPLPVDEYMEEYIRSFRIADQATKKFYSGSRVYCSTCHYWAGSRAEYAAYASKDLYDYLNSKISYEGNFDWGMASHPYPVELSDHRYIFSEADKPTIINGDPNKAMYVSWTNLEILDLYLKQPELLFNGEIRRVLYTEGGVSSGASFLIEQNGPVQAAGIALAYYKAACMDSTEAFVYFGLRDAEVQENNVNCGILFYNETKKLSYDVFKYMDTQYSFDVSNLYLKYISYRQNKVTYSYSNGRITSYKDLAKVIESNFNWEVQWKDSKIIRRNVEEKPEILQ